jgi:uncharacterized protein with HEPN domain
MAKDDLTYLRHMLDAARKVEQFTQGMERSDLESDEMLSLAVIRLLEILGEASRNVSEDLRNANPQIPWREIAGTRNRLIHGYFDVDLDIVWAIVEKDLPDLSVKLNDLILSLGHKEE